VRTDCSGADAAGRAPTTAALQQLVASGVRAQLRTGNLLTGQLYVALDFIGKARERAASRRTLTADARAARERGQRRSPRSSRK
jgi:paraquat-inducible protein B